jgi:hypothetical protein
MHLSLGLMAWLQTAFIKERFYKAFFQTKMKSFVVGLLGG